MVGLGLIPVDFWISASLFAISAKCLHAHQEGRRDIKREQVGGERKREEGEVRRESERGEGKGRRSRQNKREERGGGGGRRGDQEIRKY